MTKKRPPVKKQPASSPEPSIDITKVVYYIFLGVAVLMLGISMLSAVLIQRSAAQEKEAQGQVVELIVRKDSEGNEFYYPVVEFTVPGKGIQKVIVAEGSWPPAYQAGQPVTVLYDPAKPLNASIKSVTSTLGRWTLPIITGVLGLAFLFALLLIRWIAKSTADMPEIEAEAE